MHIVYHSSNKSDNDVYIYYTIVTLEVITLLYIYICYSRNNDRVTII